MAMMFDSNLGENGYVSPARSQKNVLSTVEERRFSLVMIGGFALFLAFAQDVALHEEKALAHVLFNMSMNVIQSAF